MEYSNEDTFVLFLEENKKSDKSPDYTGKITLPDGTERRLAAWKRVSKNDTKFLSGKVSDFVQTDF